MQTLMMLAVLLMLTGPGSVGGEGHGCTCAISVEPQPANPWRSYYLPFVATPSETGDDANPS